jgi:hypothetical protein
MAGMLIFMVDLMSLEAGVSLILRPQEGLSPGFPIAKPSVANGSLKKKTIIQVVTT